MTMATQSIAIRAPIERVFEVITDFARYPDFLPEIEEVRVMRKSAKAARVAFVANMMKRVGYTLAFELTRPTRISWTLVQADPLMKGNSGSWDLVALDQNVTEATFTADIELGIWMPQMIIDGIVKAGLPAMIEGFKKRAEEGAQRPPVSRKKRARAKSGKKCR